MADPTDANITVHHPPTRPALADPSVLTTEALQREVQRLEENDAILRNEFQEAMKARRDVERRDVDELRDRMSGSRKADRRLVAAQLDLVHERFKAENRIQNLIEDQRKERKEDDRRALDAALAAAEKARVADTLTTERANTKTELNTAEQLKLQQVTANTGLQGAVAQFNTLQTRVERIENVKQGASEQTTENRAHSSNTALWVGLAVAAFVGFNGLVLTALGIAVTFVLTRSG